MEKEKFLESLKNLTIQQINKIIETNGKAPRLIVPISFESSNI